MPVAAAVAMVAVSAYAANQQAKAAKEAGKRQAEASEAGIAEQQYQFDKVQELLAPYAKGGEAALAAQQNLIGLSGAGAQQAAISALQASPQFTELQKQGENALLQNAAATGGLRGGNLQGALAQFRPQLLNQLIESQFQKLGGLTSLGQNAAAGVGNAGLQTGSSIANLLQQQGAAQAGSALAQGQAQAGFANAIGQGIGTYAGLGGKF